VAPEQKSASRRIVLTRASGQNETLRAELLRQLGGTTQIFELPCVEFREPDETAALDDAIRSLADFAWIFFTSQNAVRYFVRRMHALGTPPQNLPKAVRVGAIGPATAEAAIFEGFSVAFVPAAGTGRTFAAAFKDSVRSTAGMEVKNSTAAFLRGVAGMKILVPRSDLALRDRGAADWTESLSAAGAKVITVTAYKTCAPRALSGSVLNQILQDGADCFVFASPSAFENFANAAGTENLRRLSGESVFAAIGPTTAATIRAAGLRCAIESAEPNPKRLAQAIAAQLTPSGAAVPGAAAATRETAKHGAKFV